MYIYLHVTVFCAFPPSCRSRFMSGVMSLQPGGLPLMFILVQVSGPWIMSAFVCLKRPLFWLPLWRIFLLGIELCIQYFKTFLHCLLTCIFSQWEVYCHFFSSVRIVIIKFRKLSTITSSDIFSVSLSLPLWDSDYYLLCLKLSHSSLWLFPIKKFCLFRFV